MSENTNIFNPTGAIETPRLTNTDLYKVSYKEGKNGIYTATVKFIVNVNNPARCIVDKQVSWVKDPVANRGMYVDDPRSIGEYSPVTDMFFKFFNTKIDAFVDYAKKNLSSKLQYASLVQIINDEQHPELNGQIKVFIYGKKIWQKIYDQEHLPGVPPVNPFHPIEGRYFYIRCVEQSGFNNFDQSMFLDKGNTSSAMWMPNLDGTAMVQIDETTDQNRIVEYLRSVSPDLSKYEYQPWTEEQAKFVDTALQQANAYLNGGTLQTNMAVLNGGMQTVAQPSFPGVGMPQANPGMQPGMGMPQQMGQPMPQQMPTPQMPTPQMPQPAAPANNSFAGFSIGSVPSTGATPGAMPAPSTMPNPGMPAPQMPAPGISGVNLPPTMNQSQTQPQQTGSIGGNIDDILNSI